MKNPLSPLKTVIGFLSDYRRKKLDLKVVKDETNLNDRSALRVLRKLTSEGLLELIDEGKLFFGHKSGVYKKNPTWKIVDRQAIANRHKPRGKASPIRDRIWKAIRIKRIFLVKDIHEAGGREGNQRNGLCPHPAAKQIRQKSWKTQPEGRMSLATDP